MSSVEVRNNPIPQSSILSTPNTITFEQENQDTQQLKDAIQTQIEFYFSQENLVKDKYLRSKMNSQMCVPLSIVCQFARIKQLTTDQDLIIEAIKQSQKVLLTENCTMIKPSVQQKQRNIIILREIPSEVEQDAIVNVFNELDCDCGVIEIRRDVGNTWFITLENEQQAVEVLKQIGYHSIDGSPVKARLKSETSMKSYFPVPMAADVSQNSMSFAFPYTTFGYSQPIVNGFFPFYTPYPQREKRNGWKSKNDYQNRNYNQYRRGKSTRYSNNNGGNYQSDKNDETRYNRNINRSSKQQKFSKHVQETKIEKPNLDNFPPLPGTEFVMKGSSSPGKTQQNRNTKSIIDDEEVESKDLNNQNGIESNQKESINQSQNENEQMISSNNNIPDYSNNSDQVSTSEISSDENSIQINKQPHTSIESKTEKRAKKGHNFRHHHETVEPSQKVLGYAAALLKGGNMSPKQVKTQNQTS